MTIKDRLDNLTDEQKIYLLQIVDGVRKMDDFAKNYSFKDEYFSKCDDYYQIGVDFCMYSYTEQELLDIGFTVDTLQTMPNINFALAVVEEAF